MNKSKLIRYALSLYEDYFERSIKKKYSISCPGYKKLLDDVDKNIMQEFEVLYDLVENYFTGLISDVMEVLQSPNDPEENIDKLDEIVDNHTDEFKNDYSKLVEDISIEGIIEDYLSTELVYIDDIADFIYRCPRILNVYLGDVSDYINTDMYLDALIINILYYNILNDYSIDFEALYDGITDITERIMDEIFDLMGNNKDKETNID